VARLLALGLAVAALLAARPAHAQTPIVPDLSGKAFAFHWGAYRGGVWTILAQGYVAIHGVDVYTGNFSGFVTGPSDRNGAVTGQYLPEGALSFSLKFTVSLPTDLWTYTGFLGKLEDGRWVVDGSFTHQDPRDPDFYEDGRWQGFEQF